MPLPKHKAERDDNEKGIVHRIKKNGVSVERISAGDIPDLIAGVEGTNIFMEVKTEEGGLREGQKDWLWDWNGRALVIRSSDEALEVMGDENTENPLAPYVPISLRSALKIAALILGTPPMMKIRAYIQARADFEKSSKRKFTFVLEDEEKEVMEALARTFTYPPAFFWDFFIDRLNAGKLKIVTLGEQESAAVTLQMIALFSAYNALIEAAQHAKDYEKPMLELYRRALIYDEMPK